MNIWSNRHLTSPRDIEWHRFELHKHRSRETYSKANSHSRLRLYPGPSFSSHLRQLNRDILAHFLKVPLSRSRLKHDIEREKHHFYPLIVQCASNSRSCQEESIYGHARGSIHITRFSLAYNFSWNFSISSTYALTTFPIRAAPVILQCLSVLCRETICRFRTSYVDDLADIPTSWYIHKIQSSLNSLAVSPSLSSIILARLR